MEESETCPTSARMGAVMLAAVEADNTELQKDSGELIGSASLGEAVTDMSGVVQT